MIRRRQKNKNKIGRDKTKLAETKQNWRERQVVSLCAVFVFLMIL